MIVGILLAAGRSSRFGGDKLTHRLTHGMSILEISARALLGAGADRTLAVVRRDRTRLTAQLATLGIRLVICPQADAGMGVSLACGVAAGRDADGWIIHLADMPFVRTSTIAAVGDRLRQGASIAVPMHAGRRGHPVGFAARFRKELLACSGDTGARRILMDNAALIADISVSDVGIFQDIDSRRDLLRAVNHPATMEGGFQGGF